MKEKYKWGLCSDIITGEIQIAKTRKYSEEMNGIVEISGEPITISDDVFKNALMQFFAAKFDNGKIESPHTIESSAVKLVVYNKNDTKAESDVNYIYLIKRPSAYACYPEDGDNSILVCAPNAVAALDVKVDGYETIKWYEGTPKDQLEVTCLGQAYPNIKPNTCLSEF